MMQNCFSYLLIGISACVLTNINCMEQELNNGHIGNIDKLMIKRSVQTPSDLKETVADIRSHKFINTNGPNPFVITVHIKTTDNSELSRATLDIMKENVAYQSANPLNRKKDYNSINPDHTNKYTKNPDLLNKRRRMISDCTNWAHLDKTTRDHSVLTLTARFYDKKALMNELELVKKNRK